MTAFLLGLAMVGASESLPLHGILDDPESVGLIARVEAALERDRELLALHRTYRAGRHERGNAPEISDGSIAEMLVGRLSASRRALINADAAIDRDAFGQGAFATGTDALTRLLIGTPGGLGAVDRGNRALFRNDSDRATGESEWWVGSLLPESVPGVALRSGSRDADAFRAAPIDVDQLAAASRSAPVTSTALSLRLAEHRGLRRDYGTYVRLLEQYPIIEQAAEAYWVEFVRTNAKDPVVEGGASVRRRSSPARPTVARPAQPKRPSMAVRR